LRSHYRFSLSIFICGWIGV